MGNCACISQAPTLAIWVPTKNDRITQSMQVQYKCARRLSLAGSPTCACPLRRLFSCMDKPRTIMFFAEPDQGLYLTDEVKELCTAAHSGDVDYVRDLLDMGGLDPNAADHNQMTALHYAAMHAREEVIKLLVQRGSDPNASDLKGGFTPLHWVVIKANPQTSSTNHVDQSIVALYRGGANVNCTDFNMCTPLHIAAQKGNRDCIDTLIRLGANPEKTDIVGRSCFSVAQNESVRQLMRKVWNRKAFAVYHVLEVRSSFSDTAQRPPSLSRSVSLQSL